VAGVFVGAKLSKGKKYDIKQLTPLKIVPLMNLNIFFILFTVAFLPVKQTYAVL